MRGWLLGIAAVLLAASQAAADGDGPDRKMTAQEAAAYGALQKTLREASPPVPSGYVASFPGFDGPAVIFQSMTPERMFRMSFQVKYTVTPEKMQEQAVGYLMGATQGSAQQQEKLAAIREKIAALKEARGNTRDRDEKDRIREQIKALNDEENRLVDEIALGAQARMPGGGPGGGTPQDLAKSLPAKELSVRFQVNQDVTLRDPATPYKLPGHPLGFEQSNGFVDFGTHCVTVLLGPFEQGKRAGSGASYTLRNAPLGVPTRPRGLAVVACAPKEKPEAARDLLAQTDLKKLAAMLP